MRRVLTHRLKREGAGAGAGLDQVECWCGAVPYIVDVALCFISKKGCGVRYLNLYGSFFSVIWFVQSSSLPCLARCYVQEDLDEVGASALQGGGM